MSPKAKILRYDPKAISYKGDGHREDRREWYVRYTNYRNRDVTTSGCLTAREAWQVALNDIVGEFPKGDTP